MKCFRRYCCVLLCLVSLLGLFSVPVSAESVDTNSYNVNIYSYANIGGQTYNFGQVDIDNGSTGLKETVNTIPYQVGEKYVYRQRLTFVDKTGVAMMRKGKTYTFTVDNLYHEIAIIVGDNAIATRKPVRVAYIRAYAGDGTYKDYKGVSEITYNKTNQTYSLKSKLTAENDIYRILIFPEWEYEPSLVQDAYPDLNLNGSFVTYSKYGTVNDNTPFALNISVESEEAGLLSGILGWIQNIFNTITDTFDAILELPAKLWGLIENGLKSLFVPDAEYMATYKDKWDELLARKFGAVYEVANITFESWDKITNSDETNTINLPNVSIPISNGQTFTFGGYDVQIVPNGFEWLVTMIKALTGGLCTILFVNGLRRRYDEIMGVEK